MCVGENDSATFIRRKLAAINYIVKLSDQGELSADQAIQQTSDKFMLNANIRDDYRIYKELWGYVSGI